MLVEENLETVNSQGPLLPFTSPMRLARFVSRRQRFLIEVEDSTGRFTAHTNNTGAMLGLVRPGRETLLSVSANPKRKLACTVELMRLGPGPDAPWAGVNTATPNRLLKAAWQAGRMPELAGYTRYFPEPLFSEGRLDARLTGKPGELWVEAKNVTLVEDDTAIFPDAVTERGSKHLLELTRLAHAGIRAALFFLVQRPDGACFGPADMIDPEYAMLLWKAVEAGVEIWPYRALVTEQGIDLGKRLPVTRR